MAGEGLSRPRSGAPARAGTPPGVGFDETADSRRALGASSVASSSRAPRRGFCCSRAATATRSEAGDALATADPLAPIETEREALEAEARDARAAEAEAPIDEADDPASADRAADEADEPDGRDDPSFPEPPPDPERDDDAAAIAAAARSVAAEVLSSGAAADAARDDSGSPERDGPPDAADGSEPSAPPTKTKIRVELDDDDSGDSDETASGPEETARREAVRDAPPSDETRDSTRDSKTTEDASAALAASEPSALPAGPAPDETTALLGTTSRASDEIDRVSGSDAETTETDASDKNGGRRKRRREKSGRYVREKTVPVPFYRVPFASAKALTLTWTTALTCLVCLACVAIVKYATPFPTVVVDRDGNPIDRADEFGGEPPRALVDGLVPNDAAAANANDADDAFEAKAGASSKPRGRGGEESESEPESESESSTRRRGFRRRGDEDEDEDEGGVFARGGGGAPSAGRIGAGRGVGGV